MKKYVLILVLLISCDPIKNDERLVDREILMKIYYKGYIDGVIAEQQFILKGIPLWDVSYKKDSTDVAKILD